MMDKLVRTEVPEAFTLDSQCLLEVKEVLDDWQITEWGVRNLLAVVSPVAALADGSEAARAEAHGYLSQMLDVPHADTVIGLAGAFLRLDKHLEAAMSRWPAQQEDVASIFQGTTLEFNPKAVALIPDISAATFKEHKVASDTIDLEAQIAHAAYLFSVLKNPDADNVARFRAAAKLLSFHVPFFAVRSGSKKVIAEECFDLAVKTLRSFEGVTDEDISQLFSSEQRGARSSRSAAQWFLRLSSVDHPFKMLSERRRMTARESHLGKKHLTLRSQFEVLADFPEHQTVLQRYFRVVRHAGKLLVLPTYMYESRYRPDFAQFLEDDELPDVCVVPHSHIFKEDLDAILRGSDPILLDSPKLQKIYKSAEQFYRGLFRRDQTTHLLGHIAVVVLTNSIATRTNGLAFDENDMAELEYHDAIEDAHKIEGNEDPAVKRRSVEQELERLESKLGLEFMDRVRLQTKDHRFMGLAADFEQADRISRGPSRGKLVKLLDKEANTGGTDIHAALRKERPHFTPRQIEYWFNTELVYDEIFTDDDLTRALWRLYQNINNGFINNLPVYEDN